MVILVGPRQSGKTTLLRHLYEGSIPLISSEPADVRTAAVTDPRGFLAFYPSPVIFDEIQYAPGLLPYIKEQVDAHRNHCGQFILTGSQNLLLMEQVTESLAGRAAVLKLLPVTRREISYVPKKPLPWESSQPVEISEAISHKTLWERILNGAYPDVELSVEGNRRLFKLRELVTERSIGQAGKRFYLEMLRYMWSA